MTCAGVRMLFSDRWFFLLGNCTGVTLFKAVETESGDASTNKKRSAEHVWGLQSKVARARENET